MVRFAVVGLDFFSCSLVEVVNRVLKGLFSSPLMGNRGSIDLDFLGIFGQVLYDCGFSVRPLSHLDLRALDVVVISSLVQDNLDVLISDALNNEVNVIVLGDEFESLKSYVERARKQGLICIYGSPFSYLDGVALGSLARDYVELLGFKGVLDVVDFIPKSLAKQPSSSKVTKSVSYTILPKETERGFSGESVLSFKIDSERFSLLFSSSSSRDLLGLKILDAIVAVWAYHRAGYVGYPEDLCRFFSRKCVLKYGGYLDSLRKVFDLVKRVLGDG